MYKIYMHTSPSGKKYIGQTKLELNERWLNGRGYAKHTPFGKAILKYGWENFKHELIEDDIETQELANEREMYWIEYYHSYVKDPKCNGYNATRGGDNCEHLSKKICQLDVEGQIIETYLSSLDVERKTGFCGRDVLACCNKDGQNSAYGYYWCYEEDFYDFIIPIDHRDHAKIQVINIDTMEIFDSMHQAADKYNIHYSGIQVCCDLHGKQHTAAGYHWMKLETYNKYNDGLLTDEEKALYESKLYPRGNKTKKVFCIETEKEYSSITEASKDTGVDHSSISRVCKGKQLTAGGFHWRYV